MLAIITINYHANVLQKYAALCKIYALVLAYHVIIVRKWNGSM